jgi:hypothetical protein
MIKKTIYLFLISSILVSCTEEIEVELDTTYARLVVDGSVSADTGRYMIELTTTSDYFSNVPAPRVVSATVELSDGENTFPLTETIPGVSGSYTTEEDFCGKPGKTYRLSIQLQEPIGGKDGYEASSDLKTVTIIDSVATKLQPDWGPEGIWLIKLWAQEPGDEENFYMFNLYRNGTLLTDTITKKVVADDRFINGNYMNGIDVMYLNNANSWETIKPGDTITLQMSGITKEYYNFINQVRQSGFSVPFFSGPPANVQGNVNNGGVGFFAAWSNSWYTTVVK